MDPLSITVSALTLVQMSAKVIQLGNNYIRGVKGAPNEITALMSELKLLDHNIQALADHLKDVASGEEGVANNLVERLKEPMAACERELSTLEIVLEKQLEKRFGKRLKWPMKAQETMDVIHRLKRYENSFVLALGVEASGITRIVHQDTTIIRQDIAAMKTVQQQTEEDKKRRQREKKFRDVISWITPAGVDPTINQNAALKLKEAGTGEWLTKSDTFKTWSGKQHSFLWLYGTAGCGKTVLSAHILDYLRDDPNGPRLKPVFFFCDFREQEKTKSLNICLSLAAQILHTHISSLPKELEELYEKRMGIGAIQEREATEILKLLANHAGNLVVLVDALDECKDRIEFLRVMKTVQEAASINFVFTSREELDIKTEVGDQPKLHITPSMIDDDIKLFIKEEIVRHPRLRKLKPDLKEKIQLTLSQGSHGMFRWAACQLELIESKRLNRDIRAALTQLPTTLEETYTRILADISLSDRDIAIRVLNWLVCSFRPMLIHEVIEAIAIELDTGNIDPEYRLEDPEDLLDICRSLIRLDSGTGSIALAHFSVKEFLMKKQAVDQFFWIPQQTNYDLVKYCITYICFDDFKKGKSLQQQNLYKEYPFYEYAAEFWMKHAYGHDDVSDADYIRQIASFLVPSAPGSSTTGSFEFWFRYYSGTSVWKNNSEIKKILHPSNNLPLLCACLFGLESTVYMLLSKIPDIKGFDGENLIAAALSGNIGVITLLLDAGADVNHVSKSGDTAICAAIRRNNIHALKYLLSRQGDILVGRPSPLFTAIAAQSPEAVEICINAGSDIREEYQGTVLNTPFHQALFTPWKAGRQIFSTLVNHDAALYYLQSMSTEVPENRDSIRIMALSEKNCIAAAKKILMADAEKGVKIADGILNYRLMKFTVYSCIRDGQVKYLRMLLLHLGAKFKDYQRVLEIATLRGEPKLMEVVLEGWKNAGGDNNMSDSLLIATVLNDLAKAKLLLEHGANPDEVARTGWSPMRFAVANNIKGFINLFRTQGESQKVMQEVTAQPTKWISSIIWIPERYEIHDVQQDSLVLEGSTAALKPDTRGEGVVVQTDIPITASTGWYTFSTTINSISSRPIRIGFVSYLPFYDTDDIIYSPQKNAVFPDTITYCSTGSITALNGLNPDNLSGPILSKGDCITCTWDIDRKLVWFMVNGERVGKVITGAQGLLMPVVHLTAGASVTSNFGVMMDDNIDLETDVETERNVSFERRRAWNPKFLEDDDNGLFIGVKEGDDVCDELED